jgi:hypothetical protein
MRNNFSLKQQREIRNRSGDICEAGKFETHKFYGMADGDTCRRKAAEIDHITADALKRTRITSIEEGLHVCQIHHRIKTHGHDIPKINKAKRLDEAEAGFRKPNYRPMPGTKASGWKKTMSGEVVRR